MSERLIYGKNNTQKIVSLEVTEDTAELFIEESPGNIRVEVIPNKYWILSNKQHGRSWVTLKGNLHYKYGIQCKTRQEFYQIKNTLKSADTYLISDPREALMVKDGYTYFKGMNPQDVSVLSFDIETTGLYHDKNSKLLLISNTYRRGSTVERKLFSFDDYQDEGEMIEKWCEWVREKNPSILLGHNIVSYDFPYIQFIADKFDVEVNLGRDGSKITFNNYESKFRVDGSRDLHYKKIRCYGREIVDTYFLSIKHDAASRKYESYGLKKIIAQEGLESTDRQFYDASQIRFKYKDKAEWEKIKAYCIHDSDDSLKLYDLMCSAYFYMSQMIPKNFQLIMESASGSQLNAMLVRSYLQDAHSIPKADGTESYEGGLSLGVSGIYSNTYKVDLLSAYPSTIIQYELYDKQKDPQAHFLTITKLLFEQRVQYKKLAKETGSEYYEGLQSAMKILINSLYGMCGAGGLNFNSPHIAVEITRYCRAYIEIAIKWATGKDYQYWESKNE